MWIQKPEDIYNLPVPDSGEAISSEVIFNYIVFESFFITWS